jgi:ComEC/Rec2-related protein
MSVAVMVGLPLLVAAAWLAESMSLAARALAGLAAATLGMALAAGTVAPPPDPGPRLLAVTGTVGVVPWQRETQGFVLVPDAVQVPAGMVPPERLFVRAAGLPAVESGDRVAVRGRWQMDTRGPVLRAQELERQDLREDGPRGWAWRALGGLDTRRELAGSLLLGQGTPPEKDDFRRSGLLHILAVSGTHLAIAAAFGAWLLRLIGLPWAVRLGALGALIAGYTWLTGGTPATQRALVMALAVLAMELLARQPHRLAAVSLAALALVVADPGNARDLGFQLSLAAVLGLITLGMDLVTLRERWLPLAPWPLDRPVWRGLLFTGRCACDGLAIGIGATVATVPLIAWHFGTLTPWAPLTTLLATPPTTAALWLGLPLMGLAGMWPAGPWDGLYVGLGASLDALASVVRWSADLPGATMQCVKPGPWALLLWPLLFLPLDSGRELVRRAVLLVLIVGLW